MTTPNIQFNDSRLIVNGEELSTHTIERVIGKGANGTVFLSENKILKRHEAIKIWHASKPGDKRNKEIQGFAEIAKLANAHAEHVVQVYSASLVGGVPYATMEYVNGRTLKQTVEESRDGKLLLTLAHMYLSAIEETSQGHTFHGDPHWSNVLIYEHKTNKYETSKKLKLCDFGTSIFTGHEKSVDRHWRLVEECVLKTTKTLKFHADAKTELQKYKFQLNNRISKGKPDFFDDLHWAKLYIAPLRDFLDYLSLEFNHV